MEGAGFMESGPNDDPHARATGYLSNFILACIRDDLEQQRDVYNEIIDATMGDNEVAYQAVELFSESTINKARIVAAVVIKYRLLQAPTMETWDMYRQTLMMLTEDYDPNVALKAAQARQQWRKAALETATSSADREQILVAGTLQTPSFLPDWVQTR